MAGSQGFVKEYAAAWSTQNVEVILSFFTEDCVYEDVALGAVNTGKQELEAFLRATFAAISDLRIEPKTAFFAGGQAANEWVMSGTQTGPFPGIPATNKRFSVRGASIMEMQQGKIRRNTDYWSLAALLQQVGVLPQTPSES
jgi:steroid delta-isomerase-like uncharacterized protein